MEINGVPKTNEVMSGFEIVAKGSIHWKFI